MPADVRESLKETIDQMRDQLKEIDDPDNPMFSPEMDENIRQIQAEQNQRYAEELKQWETENPESPEKMILEKLKVFMVASENIDFGAKLVPGYGGAMKFENPSYEEMPNIRKMCFRAGKDAVDSIRSFTREWINEIETGLNSSSISSGIHLLEGQNLPVGLKIVGQRLAHPPDGNTKFFKIFNNSITHGTGNAGLNNNAVILHRFHLGLQAFIIQQQTLGRAPHD